MDPYLTSLRRLARIAVAIEPGIVQRQARLGRLPELATMTPGVSCLGTGIPREREIRSPQKIDELAAVGISGGPGGLFHASDHRWKKGPSTTPTGSTLG
jgi:hypothetical protein